MDTFLNKNIFLNNQTAKLLFHDVAKRLPIIDYHSHIDPKDIAEDRKFFNLTQLWLNGDHYKWRLMRENGIGEAFVTGETDDFSKFEQWASTLDKAVGNPVHIWSHMELNRYFGYKGHLSSKNAREVWDFCNQAMYSGISARTLLEMSNVRLLCTTDDPVSTLKWHKQIADDSNFAIKVLPTFRPDKILSPNQPYFIDYIKDLSACTHEKIKDFQGLKIALEKRMDFFATHGCVISDHSLSTFRYSQASEEEVECIFALALLGNSLSSVQMDCYVTAVLAFLAEAYAKREWVMQLHFGVNRNVNKVMYDNLGADSGFDCIGKQISAGDIAAFFSNLNAKKALPKTIIYSLNPNDNATIDSIVNSFPLENIAAGIQHGCAWWFNDHQEGIQAHMKSLAASGLLGHFVGMLTDSRSFLSYVRHEYFRRILCDYIGELVENGQYPNDKEIIEKIVGDISYENCKSYFNFDIV